MERFKSNMVMLILVVVSNHRIAHAVSCVPVVTSLAPCIRYLLTSGALSVACCSGIRRISRAANTTSGRQATCDCVKKALGDIPSLQTGPLPNKCGVKLPFQVSLDMDCSKVV